MARMRVDVKANVQRYRQEGRSVLEIQKLLRIHHGSSVSREAIYKFLRRGVIVGRRNSNFVAKRKLCVIHKRFIHMWMSQNKELTAGNIRNRLRELFHLRVSLSTVNKARREMGWSSNTGKYCQQISHANKRARMQWSCECSGNKRTFMM